METEQAYQCLLEIAKDQDKLRDRINQIPTMLSLLGGEQRIDITSKFKSKIQWEVADSWAFENNSKGAALLPTGVGKSRIGMIVAVDTLRHDSHGYRPANVILAVPTEKLRDDNWPREFAKWGYQEQWELIDAVCYQSLHKYEDEDIDLLIMDEGHHITEDNAQIFRKNRVRKILWLSATRPRDKVKIELLRELGINPFYEMTMEEAVVLGLVAPFEVTVVSVPLDSSDRAVKSGTKDNTFYQTEVAKMRYLNMAVAEAPSKFNIMSRMRFIYNLPSKMRTTKYILTLIPENKRYMVFCGSIEQAELLGIDCFHSKQKKGKKIIDNLTKFINKEINALACVNAVNEGMDIEDLDIGIINQLNSTELSIIQRIGRFVRFRPGHIGKIIIIVAEGTVDEKWLHTATMRFDTSKFTYIKLADLINGTKMLNFT